MSHGHWMVERVIFGQNMTFNMDTLVTMWAAMTFLLVVAYVGTILWSIFAACVFSGALIYYAQYDVINNSSSACDKAK